MQVSLVSICIPTYNQTFFLRKTLESIVTQSYKNFEIIISDDSSTKEVELLVKEYADKANLVYHKNETALGSPKNWNKALDLAKGDLIKFIHHDDWFSSSDSLSDFVTGFEKNKNVDFVFCISEILDVSENTVSYNKPTHEFLLHLKNDPRILFDDNRIGSPTAVMYKKSALRFDERIKYVVDIDFYIRLLKAGNFIFIEKPLIVNTSNHPGQVTTSSINKEIQVGEYCYLYNKTFSGRIPGIKLSRFFVGLFKKYDIKRLEEIKEFKWDMPEPHWYFRLLLIWSNKF